jgi:hypothetical protein
MWDTKLGEPVADSQRLPTAIWAKGTAISSSLLGGFSNGCGIYFWCREGKADVSKHKLKDFRIVNPFHKNGRETFLWILFLGLYLTTPEGWIVKLINFLKQAHHDHDTDIWHLVAISLKLKVELDSSPNSVIQVSFTTSKWLSIQGE